MVYCWETVYYERWCGEVMQNAREVRLNLGWPVDIAWDDEYVEVKKLYINCLRWEDQKHLAEKFPNVTDLDVSIGVNPYPENQVKMLRIGISVMGRDDNFRRREFTLAGVEELTIVVLFFLFLGVSHFISYMRAKWRDLRIGIGNLIGNKHFITRDR